MGKWIVVLVFACVAAPAAAADRCELSQVGAWSVRLQRNLPVVEGAINGRKAGILLDTGAYASMVTKDAARRFEMNTRDTGEYAMGVGGDSRVLMTRVQKLRIADAEVEGMRVRVVGERPIPGIDFILGEDFFRKVDVEFDYAKGAVRLFKPSSACGNAFIAYWDAKALVVPLENSDKILFPVAINGVKAIAMLDSGASGTVVSLELAAKAGITPKSAGVHPASCHGGLGGDMVRGWVAPFDTFTIGGETIRDARLQIMEFDRLAYGRDGADLLVGTDFLRAHRVLASRHQGKLYFSYAGGQVFPNVPDIDCDDRAGANEAEAMARYDKALAENPRDTRALMGRANARWRKKDLDGALADLDAVIAIDPAYAPALARRMAVRMAKHDYDGALVDADAAIANGMNVADMYATRATIRDARGDEAGAMADLDKALELAPLHPGALRLRGRHRFHQGRFDAAARDFEQRLAIEHNPFDAIWISLARTRAGADGRAVLEGWLAESRSTDWPAPLMQYLLGTIDRDALFTLATADPAKRAGRECEARFYVAEDLVAKGKRDEGRALLEKARSDCPRDFLESRAARMELGAGS